MPTTTRPFPKTTLKVHRAELTGLTPGTEYLLQVGKTARVSGRERREEGGEGEERAEGAQWETSGGRECLPVLTVRGSNRVSYVARR